MNSGQVPHLHELDACPLPPIFAKTNSSTTWKIDYYLENRPADKRSAVMPLAWKLALID